MLGRLSRGEAFLFSFSDHFLQLVEFTPTDVARLQQVTDHVSKASFKDAVDEVRRHFGRDVVLIDGRTIKEFSVDQPMRYQLPRLHFFEHGGDGGVGPFAFAQTFMNIAHG